MSHHVSNCSLDLNKIGSEGGVALGEALANNQTLQELRLLLTLSSLHAVIIVCP